jgi:hypothetical protein
VVARSPPVIVDALTKAVGMLPATRVIGAGDTGGAVVDLDAFVHREAFVDGEAAVTPDATSGNMRAPPATTAKPIKRLLIRISILP